MPNYSMTVSRCEMYNGTLYLRFIANNVVVSLVAAEAQKGECDVFVTLFLNVSVYNMAQLVIVNTLPLVFLHAWLFCTRLIANSSYDVI